MAKKSSVRGRSDAARRCRGLYRLIRERLGAEISDREIARRWSMEWKSFAALKHGRRQVPRIDELERLAALLGVTPAAVFAAASGRPRGPAAPREAGDALALTLDRVPDALFTIDVDGRIRDFNRALPLSTGRAEGELRARSLLELVAVDSRSRALQCIDGATREGRSSAAEVVLVAGGGAARVVTLHATPVRGPDGAIAGAQLMARALSSERQALVDHIPAASILYDGDGTIVAANPLVEGVCAIAAADLVGKRLGDLFADAGSEACPVTRALRSGRVEQQVAWITNRRGQAVYVHRTAGPVAGAGAGRVIELLVDVTDQLRRGDLRVLSLWRGSADEARRRAALERRDSPRAETAFVVKYRYRRRLHEARVENLGHGGLFIQTDEQLSQGAKLELEWRLPGDNAPVRATAVVAWSRAASMGAPAGIGVRFVAVG